ncbi:hypothetical protein MRX96_006910 [Rhipicephalus microplus]
MNNYVIIEKTGEGAYGAVYKAKCKATNKIVAKKRSGSNGDEGMLATTIREVALLQKLKHENMNRTFDDAVVKKYLGHTVAAILLCHQRRVLHHDLKPANVLVDGNGDLKVTDFGLSRAFTPTRAHFPSQSGHPLVPCTGDALGCQSLLDTGGCVEYRVHLFRASDRQNSATWGFGD